MPNFQTGYWLPKEIRKKLIMDGTVFDASSYIDGRPCEPETPGAVTAHWPRLTQEQYQNLVSMLQEEHRRAPTGREYWERLNNVMQHIGVRISSPNDPLYSRIMDTVPGYTGYSQPMIQLTLNALDMISLDQMAGAYGMSLSNLMAGKWQLMGDLPGRITFNQASKWDSMIVKIPGLRSKMIWHNPAPPDFVLGYGAGNVPGTALLIALLAQSTTLSGYAPPSVLVRNSRREAIFTPLVLGVIEEIDPDLVAGIAVMVWDYKDLDLQRQLIKKSDLVIAAAGDEAIDSIGDQINDINKGRDRESSIRYHRHGHKVSFSAISREMLDIERTISDGPQEMINVIALLAGLDSIFWDQYGCLSSRMHFVEKGAEGHYTTSEYAERLCSQLRILSTFLPRGSSPLRLLKDSFDSYKLLEGTGKVRVFSDYDDEFLVVEDTRQLDAQSFYAAVNSCMGRVVIVRPVEDLMEFPQHYLKMIPPANLQSLSVAFGSADEGMSERFLQFTKACADRGVTAIRSLGRAAFPQLAYSWDGLVPLDLVRDRPAGYFSTIEFENSYEQIIATHNLFMSRTAETGLQGI